MSRPRAFDIDAATDAAVQVFWTKGYAATSMSDLYAAMGLRPGSVYAAYGDKAGLFRRAFETYADWFRATLPTDRSGLAAIVAWITLQADLAAGDPARRGCLIVNTMAEREAHSSATHALAEARMAEIRGFFIRELVAAAAAGELDPALEVDLWADSLTGVVVSLMTLGRAAAEETVIRNVARAGLAALPRP